MAEEKNEGVNVQVLLRCRPLSEREVLDRAPQVITCNEALREVTLFQTAGGKQMSRTFRFDKVFGCDSTQEKLFKQAIVPIVQEVMDGFNCTIFAYGQTGTGKTYTMEGGPRESDDGRKLSAQAGVIPRSIKQVFDTIESNNIDSTVKVSFLELYNEELTDLLTSDDDSKRLRLLEDKSGVVVQGLEEAIVKSAAEIYQVLDRGTAKRRTAATLLNNRSSRSHSVFTITIHMKEATDGEDVIKIGKLNLVDLAGSENISRSGAKDSRAREAGSINQSLLTLGRVITALVEHSGHVPYRDSKLTRLLRDSLGGRTKTCIIATIAPTVHCQEETISTLDYAHRAKNIRNRPELNQKISKVTMIKELAAEIERLKVDLVSTREKNGVFLSVERYEHDELERNQLRETVKAMKAEAEAEELAHNVALEAMRTSHAAEVDALNAAVDRKEAELLEVQDELNRANVTIQERLFVAASLKRAEQALATHADNLTTELAAAAQDITTLFGRLDEMSALQGSDREALRGVRDLVSNRLQSLAGCMDTILGQQKQHYAAVTSDLAAFKQQKEADVCALRDKVSSLQSSVRALEQSMGQHLSAISSTSTSALQQASEASQALASDAAAAGKAAHNAAESALTELIRGLEAQAAELQSVSDNQAARTQAALDSVASLSSSVRSVFKGIRSSASDLDKGSTQRYGLLSDNLQSFVQSYEASMMQQQAGLLQQIGSMVESFNKERAHVLVAAVQSIQSQMQQDRSTLSADLQGICTAAANAASNVREAAAASTASVERGAAELRSGCDSLAAAAKSSAAMGSAVLPKLQQAQSDLHNKLGSASKAITRATSSAASNVQAAAAAATQHMSSNADQVHTAQGAVLQVLEQQHAADMAVASSITQMCSEASDAMAGLGQQHRSATGELHSMVDSGVSTQLAKEVSAPVPARRDLVVPPQSAIQELMCPDEETVLQQLRNTKKEILRRGGDVRYAATLLLTSPQRQQSAPSPECEPMRADSCDNNTPMAISPAPAPPPSTIKRSKIPTMTSSEAGIDVLPVSDRSNA